VAGRDEEDDILGRIMSTNRFSSWKWFYRSGRRISKRNWWVIALGLVLSTLLFGMWIHRDREGCTLSMPHDVRRLYDLALIREVVLEAAKSNGGIVPEMNSGSPATWETYSRTAARVAGVDASLTWQRIAKRKWVYATPRNAQGGKLQELGQKAILVAVEGAEPGASCVAVTVDGSPIDEGGVEFLGQPVHKQDARNLPRNGATR
jgi:hypothetical protein